MQETTYLLSTPNNARELMESIEQLRAGYTLEPQLPDTLSAAATEVDSSPILS